MVDFGIVPAQVKPIGAPATVTRPAGTGVSIVQGEVLYIDPVNDVFLKSGANLTVEAAQSTHIALGAGTDGQPVVAAIIQRGLILDMGAGAAIGATAVVMLSANAGRMAPHGDLGSSEWSTYLGTGIGNNQVLFNVNASGTQVP